MDSPILSTKNYLIRQNPSPSILSILAWARDFQSAQSSKWAEDVAVHAPAKGGKC